jgi:DnaJ family protein A protein 2
LQKILLFNQTDKSTKKRFSKMFFGGGIPAPRNNGPDLYAILNVEKGASAADIKKAYRKLALKHHPDKCEDSGDRFKDINSAYEILSDPERRQQYDQFGITDTNNNHEDNHHPFAGTNIFEHLFRGGGINHRPQHQQQSSHGADTVHNLAMSLEELWSGKQFKLSINREITCDNCNGKGGLIMQDCRGCQGQGFQTTVRQIAPGFHQTVQSQCPMCKGSGLLPQDSCPKCNGKKIRSASELIVLTVPGGASNGDRFVQKGLGNSSPGIVPGDIVFIVQALQHEIYRRKGSTLHIDMSLTLQQALCGFSAEIKLIDGQMHTIASVPEKVTKPGSVQIIKGKGMPVNSTGTFGDLHVAFRVEFPDSVLECRELAAELPSLISVQS